MIVIIVLLVFMLIVLLRLISVEKFMTFAEVLGSVDSTKRQIFDASQGALKNNEEEMINKKIEERILNKVLDNEVKDKNSFTNKQKINAENMEVNDFITKIFKLDNQIFTDSVNHEILCNNLKYELIKLLESEKPVDMISRNYAITNKISNKNV